MEFSVNLFESQYFALVYMWASNNPGGINSFFRIPQNSKIVEKGMFGLLSCMQKYDADKSMRLSKAELDQLFKDLFPAHLSVYEQAVDELSKPVRHVAVQTATVSPPT